MIGLSDLKQALGANYSGQTVVFTNGCFDILHLGHVRYLQGAKALGDVLIIGLNTDASISRLKGSSRPIVPLEERAELLEALRCVDFVVSFDDDTPYALISELKPDILVKGGDYRLEDIVGRDVVEQHGGRVVIMPEEKGKSTTNIIERCRMLNA